MDRNPLEYFRLNSTKEEQAIRFNKLCGDAFASVVPSLEEQSYYTSIYNTTRFLIAREFDFPKSLQMWKNWCKWRISYRPHEIQFNDIANELNTGRAFHFGEDSQHNAFIIFQMCKSSPKVSDEESLRFGVWLVETALALSDQVYGGKKLSMIFDKRGYTKKQMGSGGTGVLKEAIKIMQDYYPETLEKFYLIGLDWFFRTIFGIAKPFISEKTRNKIQILENVDSLHKTISKENLLKDYGGICEFKYDAWAVFRRLEMLKKEKGLALKNDIYDPSLSNEKKTAEEECKIITHSNEVPGDSNDSFEVGSVSDEFSLVSVIWQKYQQSLVPCDFPEF